MKTLNLNYQDPIKRSRGSPGKDKHLSPEENKDTSKKNLSSQFIIPKKKVTKSKVGVPVTNMHTN